MQIYLYRKGTHSFYILEFIKITLDLVLLNSNIDNCQD